MNTQVKRHIDVLGHTIQKASSCFMIWWTIKEKKAWELNKNSLNNYSSFFIYVINSLFVNYIICLSTLYEDRNDTINFKKLLKLISRNTKLKEADLKNFERVIEHNETIYRKVKKLRNEVFAHRSNKFNYEESFKGANITSDEIKDLIESSKNLITEIGLSCDLETRYFYDEFAVDDTTLLLNTIRNLESSS